MGIFLVRLIECDGCNRLQAAAENESARETRYFLARKGWSRCRRGQSMVDLCKECSANNKEIA